jgi:O-acetyl-ADP-ribose deacetylase (regulator of RNase III)
MAINIQVIYANIVNQPDVDAIVNSANANLRSGSGVAGAIHAAAGPQLEQFCKPLVPLGLGAAVITPGFNLPNKWVIHIRASHYLKDDDAQQCLERALNSMMALANSNGIESLALPAVGTGVFQFPPRLAAQVTARVLREHELAGSCVQRVTICLADPELKQIYESVVNGQG